MNYFFIRKNSSIRYHIGKLSVGWAFLFRGYDNEEGLTLKSFQDWEIFLSDDNITVFTEADEAIKTTTLLNKISQSRTEKRQAVEDNDNKRWCDPEGFVFDRDYFC